MQTRAHREKEAESGWTASVTPSQKCDRHTGGTAKCRLSYAFGHVGNTKAHSNNFKTLKQQGKNIIHYCFTISHKQKPDR